MELEGHRDSGTRPRNRHPARTDDPVDGPVESATPFADDATERSQVEAGA